MVSNSSNKVQYQIAYPFSATFVIALKYWLSAEIYAILSTPGGDITLNPASDFSVSAPGETGTLTRLTDWDHTGTQLTIYRLLDLDQGTDYRNGEAVDLDQIEQDFDLSVARDQQLQEAIDRVGLVPITDSDSPGFLPSIADRASKFAAWDAIGKWMAAAGIPSVPATAFMATVLDDTTETEAQNTLGLGAIILTSGSPYYALAVGNQTLIINATTNPKIVYLPETTILGTRIRIINASGASNGLVKITPYGADTIGSAGAGVSVYLQNVDQGGAPFYNQSIELVVSDSFNHVWSVVGGQFCPHQTVDTDGQQYHLGKLHHLPLGNTTDRRLVSAEAVPALGNYSTARQATGNVGIPLGAKAIRVRAIASAIAAAAGQYQVGLSFTDNNSNAPTYYTAHPMVCPNARAAAASESVAEYQELDIPLNASGQFYMHTWSLTNCTGAVNVVVVGFYMGD